MLERLRAIDWSDDSKAFEHANSRALLMREYLRRAALWARAYGAERSWPFFDIAEHVDAAVQTPPEVATNLAEILSGLGPPPSGPRAEVRSGGRCSGMRRSSGLVICRIPTNRFCSCTSAAGAISSRSTSTSAA